MGLIKEIVLDLISDNKENMKTIPYSEGKYSTGYSDGYNDALVDLLNILGIRHNESIIND